MKKEQLAEFIGNIDDRLVQQAEQIPDYGQQRRRKWIRYIAAAAASIALVVGSFSMGALAFAREVVVEVPVEQETISLEGTGLSMILPEHWRGKYSVVRNGQNYIVYSREIRGDASEEMGEFDRGVLFSIVCYKEAMTPEQFEDKGYDFVAYRYLLSTKDSTYILCYASDVQWNPEIPEQETEYLGMEEEIKDIKFIVDNILAD